jgi:hypothetical protein
VRFSVITVVSLLSLFLASGVSAQSANAPAPPLSPTEQALITAENSFIRAAKNGDIGFFKRTLTDDFSYVSFDGQLYDRQDMIDQYGQPGTNVLPYEMKVIPSGENTAIVTYNVVYTVPPAEDEGPPPRYQHFSTVWVKQADTWKMKFQQMTASHWGDW